MKMDYKSAGVDIKLASEILTRVKKQIETTFTPEVLSDIGAFGAMVDLTPILKSYKHPVLVQSVDGVGTKMIVARMMNRFDTIGIDLLSATCNDIVVHGAKPISLLDYYATDRLKADTMEAIIAGLALACKEIGVSLIGGETAEMPGTYLSGEHDLVGLITGIVEKNKVITGKTIRPGDVLLGIPSSGLHTNGYSLARRLFFDVGAYRVDSYHPELQKTVGETLLEPHLNYTKPILNLIAGGLSPKGMAHITGGGFYDNISRILPEGTKAEVRKGTWPVPPVFKVLEKLGELDEQELYRTFNMGIGLTLVAEEKMAEKIRTFLKKKENITAHEIGRIIPGSREVILV